MRKIWITVIASLAVHGAPALLLSRFPSVLTASAPSASPPADPVDRWTGNTAELGAGPVYDVHVDPPGGARPSVPAQPEQPAQPPPPPPAPPPPVAPAPPRPAHPVDPGPTVDPAPTHDAPRPPSPRPRKPRPASPSASASAASSAGPVAESGGGGPPGGSFGAEGPGSVRDLGRAFTRAIPPACQADPAWSKLAAGAVGTLEITIHIDETGHITPWTPPEGDAPRQLVALVKRTLALLEAGTFGLRPGAVSAGAEVLRIRASLTDVEASETGGAAGLSFAYDHGKGKAAFTQPGGRHVEVSVEVVKVIEGG